MKHREATPGSLGYRWPAEWEPHAATWLAYPHNRETWPGAFEPARESFERFLQVVAEHEPVRLLADPSNVDAATRRRLQTIANVDLIEIPTNDAWVRDYGPIFLSRSESPRTAAVVWRYNAWGGKYPPFDSDAEAGSLIAEAAAAAVHSAPWTLEGGAIEGNGQGDLLTTAACLLNPNRNRNPQPAPTVALLEEFLGVRSVHWLPESRLAGDDTDGHVDQLARFVDPHTIVAAIGDRSTSDHTPLAANVEFLRRRQATDGSPFEVVPLPLPSPRRFRQHRLPASYCNFFCINDAVIVPTFRDAEADDFALGVLRELFPRRRVIGLDALDLVWGLGAFHCLSQPQFADGG